jgi:ribosomal protein L37E
MTAERVTTALRPKRRSRSRVVVSDPLGSLTQRDHQTGAICRECGSRHVTRLSLSLTDGTPVEFTSCHRCEHRSWEHAGSELTMQSVLDRTRKS